MALDKLFIYLIGIILGGMFILGGLLADNYYSAAAMIVGFITISASLLGVGNYQWDR